MDMRDSASKHTHKHTGRQAAALGRSAVDIIHTHRSIRTCARHELRLGLGHCTTWLGKVGEVARLLSDADGSRALGAVGATFVLIAIAQKESLAK